MSNLFDESSLAMIPTAYKEDKLYSLRSTDGSGDFTFSRGSNLAATRVDVNGLIEKGRENLATYSNDFSNGTWAKSNLSVASSNGAWEVTDNTTSGSHYIFWGGTTPASSVVTLSIEAKAGSVDYLVMRLGGFTYAFFNLSNGTLGSVNGAFIDAKIEATSDGFYKCSATINTPSSGNATAFYPTDNSSSVSYTGTGAVAITIKDAQLEKGLVASDVISTTTTSVSAGILEDMPRLDYSGGASCPSLLLEPQRTNLLPHSEYFVGFTTTATNVASNTGISPEGVQNASSVIETTATSSRRILPSSPFTGTANTYYNLSVYVKKISGQPTRHIYWLCQLGADAIYAHFDMDNFTLHQKNTNGNGSNVEADIIPVGNDWYRLTMSGIVSTASGGDYYNQLYFEDTPRTGFNGQSYTGNGTSGFELYGWQIEQGSYPTSYIPTYGTSQTRSGDNANPIDVSSLGVTTGYTLFFEIGENDLDSTTWLIQRNSGGTFLYQQYGHTAILNILSGFVYPFGLPSGRNKVAIVFDGTNIYPFLNGVKQGTYVASDDWASFGDLNLNNNPVKVNWKQLLVFPTALTDSECIALTTIA